MVEEKAINDLLPQISASGRILESWIEQQSFRGWDPFDALNSPLLKQLTFGKRRLGQFWVQVFKHSPINFRRLFGVPKGHNPKGMGLFLASYLRKYLLDGSSADRDRVEYFFDWLCTHISPGFHGLCWGYNFDWPNRGFFAPAGTPTIVNTAFIGLALLDLSELSGPKGILDGRLLTNSLELARQSCDFIIEDLNRFSQTADELCFSYTPLDNRFVHNANVFGGRLLARVAARTGEPELKQLALASARFTARRLRPEGYWPYGEGVGDAWVDNFHTGYVLVSLRDISRALQTNEFDEIIQQAFTYWDANFLGEDGSPKYYSNSPYPIDSHSAAQAILTYLEFRDKAPMNRYQAFRVAQWAITNMQAPEGFFHYQIHSMYRNRIPYMRWSQAWMQRALIELEWKEANENLA